jgi:hypothetical protein
MAKYNNGLDDEAGGYDTSYEKYIGGGGSAPSPRLDVVGVKPQARYSDSWSDVEFNRSVEKPRAFDKAQIERPRAERWQPGTGYNVSTQNQR